MPPKDLWKWVFLLDADCVCFNLVPLACFKLVNAGCHCADPAAKAFWYVNYRPISVMVLEFKFGIYRAFLLEIDAWIWHRTQCFFFRYIANNRRYSSFNKDSPSEQKYNKYQYRDCISDRIIAHIVWQA